VFRRRNRDKPDTAAVADGDEEEFDELLDEDVEAADAVDIEVDDVVDVDEPEDEPEYDRAEGPWDIAELDEPADSRVDLGGVLVPAVDGMELRVDVADNKIIAATIVLKQSAVQVQAFAAPKTEGIWHEVRDEIAAEVTRQGGIVDQADGPFGIELRAQVPVPLPDGNRGVQLVRFIGCDGPRWFLRGVISGQGAVKPDTAEAVEDVFRRTVVNRGTEAMAPRDPIPLRLPEEMQQQAPPDAAQASQNPYSGGLNPFDRGPEITEVR
jgi:hypothetical protein